jgi:putative heme iron utilization protein
MTGRQAQPFGQDVVDAVCRHMNDDHGEDALLITRTLGGVPDASSAEAVGVDAEAMEFRVVVGAGRRQVRVLFARPVTERPQIRTTVVELYERACRQAGIVPRGHG